MISVRQIKAARALIDMSQILLAEKSGISPASLSAIERGEKTPRVATLENIVTALELEGVEFIQGEGVRLADCVFNFNIIGGLNDPKGYLQDIIECLKKSKGNEYLCMLNEETDFDIPYRRRALYIYCKQLIRYGFKERIIVPKGREIFYAPSETTRYRVLPDKLFGNISNAVYGRTFVIYEKNKSIIIENDSVSESFRKQFEFFWDQAIPVSTTKTGKLFKDDVDKWG